MKLFIKYLITNYRAYNQYVGPEFPGSKRGYKEDNYINNQINQPVNKMPYNKNIPVLPKNKMMEGGFEDSGVGYYDSQMYSQEPILKQTPSRTRTRAPLTSQSFQPLSQNYVQNDPNISADHYHMRSSVSPRGTVYPQPQYNNIEPDYYENSTLNQSMDLMKMASVINSQNRTTYSEPAYDQYDQYDQYEQYNQMPYNVIFIGIMFIELYSA